MPSERHPGKSHSELASDSAWADRVLDLEGKGVNVADLFALFAARSGQTRRHDIRANAVSRSITILKRVHGDPDLPELPGSRLEEAFMLKGLGFNPPERSTDG